MQAVTCWLGTFRRLPPVLIAWAAFVFIAPNIDLAAELQWHDGQRIAQLLLLATVLATFLIPGIWREVPETWMLLPFWVRCALAISFLLGLVSSICASLPRWAFLEWSMFWLLLVLVLSVAGQFRRCGERAEIAMVIVIFATATAYAVSAIVVYVSMLLYAPVYGQVFDIRELFLSFSNLRFFGHVQTMLLPFLLLPAIWWGHTGIRRVGLWVVPAAWWTLAMASGTRGTWVALLLGLVSVALYSAATGHKWIKWQIGGLTCGLVCYSIFVLFLPKWMGQSAMLLHRTEDIMSLSLRDVLWRNALTFITDHPMLGIGPMHYAYSVRAVGSHPHNALFQWSAEWGVPSAFLFFGVCIVAGFAYAKHVRSNSVLKSERSAMIRTAMLASLAGAGAQAMVDGIIVMPVSQTILAGLIGCAIAMTNSDRPAFAVTRSSSWMAITTLFAASAVIYGVKPEIMHLAERERAYLASSPPDIRLLPRFWAHGLLDR